MGKYLDSTGLSHLIGLIKTTIGNVQTALANYLPLAGGTMTGQIGFSGTTALPHSVKASGFHPVSLNGSFAQNGVLSYMTRDEFFDSLSNRAPTTTTTDTDVITVNSANATISSVSYAKWGRVAMLYIQFKNKNAILVPDGEVRFHCRQGIR